MVYSSALHTKSTLSTFKLGSSSIAYRNRHVSWKMVEMNIWTW